MQIVDLRQVTVRMLDRLLDEEAQHWREELHWDYRPSLQLIRKFIDARSLAGYAALADGEPAAYGFYVLEEQKGLIGGLFVSPKFLHLPISQKLLSEMLATLRATPKIERIEAQLMPFGATFDRDLIEHNFRLFTRQFMLLRLEEAQLSNVARTSGLRLEPWNDRYFESCARLIRLAYANHVDSEINDQYRTEAGALRFLKNIIILPGCGQFRPEASFMLQAPGTDQLIGVVLTSSVSAGVAHTTQICVLPGYQGQGLGRRLMETSIQALKSSRFHALSLTVTTVNSRAVRLYERMGFHTVKTFSAAVWQA